MPECRICFIENNEKFISPCKCQGTIKYVHKKCFNEWIKHSNSQKCLACKYEYEHGIELSVIYIIKFIFIIIFSIFCEIIRYSILIYQFNVEYDIICIIFSSLIFALNLYIYIKTTKYSLNIIYKIVILSVLNYYYLDIIYNVFGEKSINFAPIEYQINYYRTLIICLISPKYPSIINK